MSIYDWLVEFVFPDFPPSAEPYIFLTVCILAVLFVSLVIKALCYALNIFIH